jgi:protease-4
MRTGFSPESREMASWLADAAFGELVAAVAAGRRCDDDAARRLIDASPFTDRQALEARAVDALCAEEELTAKLEGKFQHWPEIRRRLRPLPPRRPGRAVGLIRVEGLILDGRSRRPPASPPFPLPIIGSEQSGDLTVVRQARQLAASRRVGAVVLWIDSGGGSATASEAMTSALRDLAGRKPLVVAMGSLAASGGYYVATPAARVFAQPSTLTGSIGVFGGKLATGDLLRRLLVNTETVARGEHVAMFGPERPFSPAEREWVRQSIARTYELFLERVGGGRGRPAAEIDPVAGGRVWTGRQALEHGLVDQLGGFQEALTEARRRGGLRADAPVIEVAGGRGEVSPLTGAAGLLEHAGAALEGLNRAPAWTLFPWWFREG